MAWMLEKPSTKNLIYVRFAYKIKLKNANKKRSVTVRREIFLNFLKTSIADLITQLSSSLQKSEGGGDGDSGNSRKSCCHGVSKKEKRSCTAVILKTTFKHVCANCRRDQHSSAGCSVAPRCAA
jgi:hypothetical protein